jgi:hypothetical protein
MITRNTTATIMNIFLFLFTIDIKSVAFAHPMRFDQKKGPDKHIELFLGILRSKKTALTISSKLTEPYSIHKLFKINSTSYT